MKSNKNKEQGKLNKLFSLLQLLDQQEQKRFKIWLASPWSNTNKNLMKLYDEAQLFFPDFAHKSLDEYLYKKLYPHKPFDKAQWKNLMSGLLKQLEQFLVHEKLTRPSPRFTRDLMEVLGQKNQLPMVLNKLNHLQLKLKQNLTYKTEDYWWLSESLEQLYRQSDRKIVAKNTYLKDAGKNLDQYYLLRKLRLLVEERERALVYSSAQNSDVAYSLLRQLIPDSNNEAIAWYDFYFQQKSEDTIDEFILLKDKFLESLEQIEKKDQHLILILLINRAIRLKVKGKHATAQHDMFELYKLGEQYDLLLQNGRITPQSFANIVATANSTQQFAFARKFVNDYTSCLASELQNDGKRWALAQIEYLSGLSDLTSVITSLEAARTQYTTFSLRIRVLLIQIRFDAYLKDEYDIETVFWNSNIAFARQLQRDKIDPKKHINALENFNDYTKALAKHVRSVQKRKVVRKKLKKLAENLSQEKNIHAKDWLLSRVEIVKRGID